MLTKSAVTALLALAACCADAGPVLFTTTLYETSAFADAGSGSPDSVSDSSTLSSLPLMSFAEDLSSSARSQSFALADAGILRASVDVSSLGAPASARGTSRFLGMFAGSGLTTLSFDFSTFEPGTSGSTILNSLFVSFISDGLTLANQTYTNDQGGVVVANLALGSLNTLEFYLLSSADASAGRTAFPSAMVSFSLTTASNAVSEPSSLSLALFALIAGCASWRKRSIAVSQVP